MTDADLIFHLDEAIRVAEFRASSNDMPPSWYDEIHPKALELAWRTMFKLPYDKADKTAADHWRRAAQKLRDDRDGIVAEVRRETAAQGRMVK